MEETTDPLEPTQPVKPIQPDEPIPAVIPNYAQPELVLGSDGKYFLHTAGKWATFLGILGFIGTGFLVIYALFFSTIFSAMGALSGASGIPSAMMGSVTFIVLLFAVLYFFISFFLYQFGTNAKRGVTYNDPLIVTKALKNLKSHLKILGICAIVVLSIYAIVFLVAIVYSASR